jgi:hypothetical protein
MIQVLLEMELDITSLGLRKTERKISDYKVSGKCIAAIGAVNIRPHHIVNQGVFLQIVCCRLFPS